MPEAIKLVPVESSNIAGVGFDPSTSTLYVQFKNGKCIGYMGTTKALYDSFLNAPSVGSFYHQNIRGKFIGQEVVTS